MPSSPPQELRHASNTPGDGRVTPIQDASSQVRAATEDPELPTVSNTQSACPRSSGEAVRPRKKYKNYKSTIYSDTRAPKLRGRPPAVQAQPNVISDADFAWLLGVVSDHDNKKKRGGNVGPFYALLNTRLAHLEKRVLNNFIKQARRRLELKQQHEQKARDEEARVRHEAEEAKARLEQEVEAKRKLAADASALAEENAKLVAQCKRLEEAVEAHDAAVAKAKQDLEEQRKRAGEEASSSYTSMIKQLKTKIQEQDQQVEEQQEILKHQEQASRTLREQISGSTMAEKKLKAAKEKLAKAEAANLELSQVLSPKLKELGQLKTQLQAAEATLARQQRLHRAQLEQFEMQLCVAKEQRDEAFASLDLFSRASTVEHELKKLKMAASCAYNEDARFKSRKSPFKDGPFCKFCIPWSVCAGC